MSLRSNALCTVDHVKSFLGVEDDRKNESIELYVNAASDIIEEYLGYDANTQTYTEQVYDGNGTRLLITRARPITAITTLLCEGDTVDTDDFINREWYIDGDDYVFVTGNSNYKLTYTAGYSSSTMPAAIKLACVKLAAVMAKEDGRTGSLGTSSISHGDGSRTFFETTYDTILNTIYSYKRLYG